LRARRTRSLATHSHPQEEHMAQQPAPASRHIWAYAYQLMPPQPQERLQGLRDLLERERMDAQLAARTWEGRLVSEPRVTHVLVVSDHPELDLESNRRLEAELLRSKVGFAVTAPLAVGADPAAAPGSDPREALP
jgi:hypothetical protein